MNRNALIIFVRPPELGKVKTRIAATLGEAEALRIYQRLLRHTLSVTRPLAVEKFVFYAGAIPGPDLWSEAGYFRLQQHGADLGERMSDAFRFLLDQGFGKVCIIGSDCYELTTEILDSAFDQLGDKRLVIGPAQDGGYYLLGLTRFYPSLFTNMKWSTDTVRAETIERARTAGLSAHELPLLRDIDVESDLPEILRES